MDYDDDAGSGAMDRINRFPPGKSGSHGASTPVAAHLHPSKYSRHLRRPPVATTHRASPPPCLSRLRSTGPAYPDRVARPEQHPPRHVRVEMQCLYPSYGDVQYARTQIAARSAHYRCTVRRWCGSCGAACRDHHQESGHSRCGVQHRR